jgi:hypothetical protein
MPAPRRRPAAAAAGSTDQPTLDQAMVDLPTAPPAPAAADYLGDIEAAGRVLVAVLDGAPDEDADDLRRIVAILRSVYRRQRARTGSVL